MENPYQPFKEETDFQYPENRNQFESTENEGMKRVRLRAVETESEYFLKLLNISAIRWLAIVQAVASIIIILSQILMYSTAHTRYYKVVDYIGIGIWGPTLFFGIASGLTYLTSRIPSGCLIGTAMGMQITSVILCLLLLISAIISLIQHGHYNYGDGEYNAEVPGRVFCSFMIISAAAVFITGIFVSVHFCRAVCCGRHRIVESVMFDVETVK